MTNSNSNINYPFKTTLDMADKGHVAYLMRKWGVSVHQLRAAVRGTRSDQIKKIEDYLRDKGAI